MGANGGSLEFTVHADELAEPPTYVEEPNLLAASSWPSDRVNFRFVGRFASRISPSCPCIQWPQAMSKIEILVMH
jgi:hypothetical protein